MMTGHQLILWTIRAALALYVAALAIETSRRRRAGRWLWTAACSVFVLHVGAAYHFHHHWSHRHAVEETARQTVATLGVEFGAGIWFSYLFMLVWIADAAWQWVGPNSYAQRARWLHAVIHAYLFFIAFNGAVVFESGVTRGWGIAATIGLAGLLVWRRIVKNVGARRDDRAEEERETSGVSLTGRLAPVPERIRESHD